jgi:hypothetical protein
MDITGKIIKGINYSPLLCRKLNCYDLNELETALSNDATFFLNTDEQNKIAVSWWVSAKRTRSYPYARVYDSYGFSGKKVTIIPIMKDEGLNGDRDFLQWDTISLMSLLNIYVIIAYYKTANKSSRFGDKITDQRFDIAYLKEQINQLSKYHDFPLHWNLYQITNIQKIGTNAIKSYEEIGKKLGVRMHSRRGAEKKINELMKDKSTYLKTSRRLAKSAQGREKSITHQAENVDGSKASLTISNYLGGNYYFTSDEVRLRNGTMFLVEAKHTKEGRLPSLEDIKDGLIRMILFTNLEKVSIKSKIYRVVPLLKLTSKEKFNLGKRDTLILNTLKEEANLNRFKIEVNGKLQN